MVASNANERSNTGAFVNCPECFEWFELKPKQVACLGLVRMCSQRFDFLQSHYYLTPCQQIPIENNFEIIIDMLFLAFLDKKFHNESVHCFKKTDNYLKGSEKHECSR